ncbi:hypothetical protein G6F50_013238 [Rhizopus delemar]|uniref:Uncharacterized protein n=1 Tax=Rhizopus delemar TaxID=936053 RepID=A0A9P7CFG8_9FUNG|nr:hypothetical protein G6F50_013238 [Rhizopus delemar]
MAPALAVRWRERVRVGMERRQRVFRQIEQGLPVPITEIQFFPLFVRLHVQAACSGQRHRRMQRAQPRRTDHPLPRLCGVGVDQFLWQRRQLRWIGAAIEELIATVAGMADQVEDHACAPYRQRGNSGKRADIGNGTTGSRDHSKGTAKAVEQARPYGCRGWRSLRALPGDLRPWPAGNNATVPRAWEGAWTVASRHSAASPETGPEASGRDAVGMALDEHGVGRGIGACLASRLLPFAARACVAPGVPHEAADPNAHLGRTGHAAHAGAGRR